MHFAPLKRQVLFRATGVTRDESQFYTQGLLNQFGNVMTRGADRGGRAFRGLRDLAQVVQRLVAVGARIENTAVVLG